MYRMHDIIEVLRAQPFRPFRIHVSDGASFEVGHPEFVKVSASQIIVFTPVPNQPHSAFQRYDSLAMIHVTRLEFLESAIPAANN